MWVLFNAEKEVCPAGIEVTDFQTPDKMSDTVNYLPDILKIHQTLCQRVWVLDFKCA